MSFLHCSIWSSSLCSIYKFLLLCYNFGRFGWCKDGGSAVISMCLLGGLLAMSHHRSASADWLAGFVVIIRCFWSLFSVSSGPFYVALVLVQRMQSVANSPALQERISKASFLPQLPKIWEMYICFIARVVW